MSSYMCDSNISVRYDLAVPLMENAYEIVVKVSILMPISICVFV